MVTFERGNREGKACGGGVAKFNEGREERGKVGLLPGLLVGRMGYEPLREWTGEELELLVPLVLVLMVCGTEDVLVCGCCCWELMAGPRRTTLLDKWLS